MDSVDTFTRLLAFGDIRLVGYHQQEKAGSLQVLKGFLHAGEDFQLGHRGRRIRFSVPHSRPIEHSVAVEKDRAWSRAAHRTDSHVLSPEILAVRQLLTGRPVRPSVSPGGDTT